MRTRAELRLGRHCRYPRLWPLVPLVAIAVVHCSSTTPGSLDVPEDGGASDDGSGDAADARPSGDAGDAAAVVTTIDAAGSEGVDGASRDATADAMTTADTMTETTTPDASGGDAVNEPTPEAGVGIGVDGADAADDEASNAAADDASDARAGANDASRDSEGDGGSDGPEEATTDAADAAEDDAADAASESGAAAGETLSIIQATQGDECASCAAANCLVDGQTCEALGAAVATQGPSVGVLRSVLCGETLSCVIDSTPFSPCYDEGAVPWACYCGPTETSPVCEADGPGDDAQCGTQELNGVETTDPETAWERLNSSSTNLGSQMANAIAVCLDTACAMYCLF